MPTELTSSGTILVIDDEPDVCRLLVSHLQTAGYRAEFALDTATVHQQMAARSIDLALLDLIMPDGDGLEVLAWLRRHYPHTGVLMASVVDTLDTVIGALRAGAIGYLIKPFDMDLVLENVQRAMDRQQLERKNRAYQHQLERLVARRSAGLRRVQVELQSQLRELQGRDRMVQLQMAPPDTADQAHEAIARIAMEATGATFLGFWLLDPQGRQLVLVASVREQPDEAQARIASPVNPATMTTSARPPAAAPTLWYPDSNGSAGDCISGSPAGAALEEELAYSSQLDMQAVDCLPVRVFRQERPGNGRSGEAAAPVRYRHESLGVLHATGLTDSRANDILWRLGREAAIALRMVQVARALERGQAEIGALLEAEQDGEDQLDG